MCFSIYTSRKNTWANWLPLNKSEKACSIFYAWELYTSLHLTPMWFFFAALKHLLFLPDSFIFHPTQADIPCSLRHASTTSGHTDHYSNFTLMLLLQVIYWVSPYTLCSLLLLRGICILLAMQENNSIHFILLPALLRMQRHLQMSASKASSNQHPLTRLLQLLFCTISFTYSVAMTMVFQDTERKGEKSCWDSSERLGLAKRNCFSFLFSSYIAKVTGRVSSLMLLITSDPDCSLLDAYSLLFSVVLRDREWQSKIWPL